MDGINHEINFWKDFVRTDRFLKGWCEPIKTPELSSYVYEFITKRLPAKVLDCGSGVCSILNGTVPNEDLVVCDLLAKEYKQFFSYQDYDIVRPLPLACEELPYDQDFDIVHISNALDHTQNPVLAYERLLAATKVGGSLIIQGFENEGQHENWEGLHQWSLRIVGTALELANREGIVDSWFGDITAQIYLPELNKTWFIYIKENGTKEEQGNTSHTQRT